MMERPLCPKCQIRMMLAGGEPSFAGPDLRTVECPKCGLAYKALESDAIDPEQDIRRSSGSRNSLWKASTTVETDG